MNINRMIFRCQNSFLSITRKNPCELELDSQAMQYLGMDKSDKVPVLQVAPWCRHRYNKKHFLGASELDLLALKFVCNNQ